MNRGSCIVIGAGHNGLACAWHLARAGRKVLVLEAASDVGGAAVTRAFAPGFRVSACAHLLRSFPAALIEEMALAKHGLRFATTAMPTHALREGAPALRVQARSISDAGDGSAADAAAYAGFRQRMDRYATVLGSLMQTTPPRLTLNEGADRLSMLKLGWQLRRLGREGMRELLRIGGMNAFDLFDDHFESAALKGALAFDAVLGAEHGPRAPGTVLTWLQRLAGEANAGAVGLAQPVGGVGALAQAMAAAARAAGAEIRTGARVAQVIVEGDKACGVQLAGGESLRADSVISNADPRTTLFGLLGTGHLDTGLVRKIRHHRASGRVAKLHLALDALPAFTGLDAQALGGRLLVSPSMDYLERAFNPCKYNQIPAEPALEITLPTLNDPGLAPPGRHVMSVIVQFVPYDLGPDPAAANAARATLLHNVLAVLERHAPGLRSHVEASELLTPVDLEHAFGMTGGHWHHGALSFDQFFFNRPVPGLQRYRAPVQGLYLCGAGSHPGGDLMGIAGRNAARQVLDDDRARPRSKEAIECK